MQLPAPLSVWQRERDQIRSLILEHGYSQRLQAFTAVIGEQSPFVLIVTSYPSLAELGKLQNSLYGDKEFVKAWDEYNTMDELPLPRLAVRRALPTR